MGKFVPGANGKTIIASIDAVAERGAELGRDVALVLDRKIGNATAGIELIGRRKSIGRANIQAGAAGPAAIRLGDVGGKARGREYRAEEQPGTELTGN